MENAVGAHRADAPDGDMSRWEQRHGSAFQGTFIPFGAVVDYKPTPGRIDSSKAAPSTRSGVFMGYRMRTGSKWSGQYLVFDIDVFQGMNLGIDSTELWGSMIPMKVKTVKYRGPPFFPCKQRYTFHNNTVEGRDDVANRENPNYDIPVDPAAPEEVVGPPVQPQVADIPSASQGADVPPETFKPESNYKTDALGR